MDPKVVRYIFLGYSRTRKGYKCYSPQLHKKFISVDVTFYESIPFYSIESENFQEDSFKEVMNIPMKPRSGESVYQKEKERTRSF